VVFAIEQLADVQSAYTLIRHQFILNKLLLKQAPSDITVHDLEAVYRLLD
jgi:outer membrane protein